MTAVPLDDSDLAQLRRIDRLADGFEDAWDRGERPEIESWLARAEPTDRDALLPTLLELEWELRTRDEGEAPSPDTYRVRFPRAELVVDRLASGPKEPKTNSTPSLSEVYERLRGAGLVDEVDITETDTRKWLDGLVAAGRVTELQALIARGELDLPLSFGTYVIRDKLGAGGMGGVYRATHRLMDRDVAIKFLESSRESDSEGRKRFFKEIRATSRLDHPGAVASLDADFWGDRPYLVMELVQGKNLNQHVVAHGPMSEDEALRVVSAIAETMAYAHARGILHRDLKPSNIMRTPSGAPKLLDLGLARLADAADAHGRSTLTVSGHFAGTPDFASPEQAWCPDAVEGRSDVYSLGCTLYFLLTGEPPFRTPSAWLTLIAHRDAPRADPTVLRPDLTPGTARLVQEMMSAEIDDRPSSMAECLRRIDALTGRNVSDISPATSTPRTGWRWAWGLIGATLLFVGVIIWNGTNERGSPTNADTDHIGQIHTEALASKAPLAATTTPKFVWSESSLVYHDFDCFVVDRILPANRRTGDTAPPGKTRHACRPKGTTEEFASDRTTKDGISPSVPVPGIAAPAPISAHLAPMVVAADPLLSELSWIEVLPRIDIERDRYLGGWILRRGVLANTTEQSRIVVHDVLRDSYQLELRFTRISGDDGLSVSLPVLSNYCELNLSGYFGRAHGLQTIDGKPFDGNDTTIRPGFLENGREYRLAINVRAARGSPEAAVEVDLDGNRLLAWRGDVARLSKGAHPPPNRSRIALGVSNCFAEFRSIRLGGAEMPSDSRQGQ